MKDNFFSLFESSLTGMVIVDLVGIVLYSNPAAERLFGQDRDVLVGKFFGSPLVIDKTAEILIPRCGSMATVLMQVSEAQWNGSTAYLVSLYDITERKQTEKALQESEANFRNFFESMTDMIWVCSPEGRILFANSSAASTLGFSPTELTQMHILEVHPKEVQQEASGVFAAMLNGECEMCPLPLARKEGSSVPVETRVWSGRWNGMDCIFGISKNLTAEQEAHQRFERLFRNNPAPACKGYLRE